MNLVVTILLVSLESIHSFNSFNTVPNPFLGGNNNQNVNGFRGNTGASLASTQPGFASNPYINQANFPQSTTPSQQSILLPGECGSERQAFYKGECRTLLKKGPCDDGEWLVLSYYGGAECQKKKCSRESVFYAGRCVDKIEGNACPRNQILYVDMYGEAECDCDINHRFNINTGSCYGEYEQGFCGYGQYIVFYNNDMICVPNPCVSDQFLYTEGRCFRKLYQGYCPPSDIDLESDRTADCKDRNEIMNLKRLLTAPSIRSCSAGSRTGVFGRCRSIFKVPTVATRPRSSSGCSGIFKSFGSNCRGIFSF